MLRMKNDWERLSYWWDGKLLDEVTHVEMEGQGKLRARLRPTTRRYSDHGREHTVETRILEVYVPFLMDWVTLPYASFAKVLSVDTTPTNS
jgi:hypothetical protein